MDSLENVLSSSSNRRLLSEVANAALSTQLYYHIWHFQAHLLLAKCYKGLSDLKTAISCCNSAIEQNSKWKEPFLYRSACFQALHVAFLETEGDTKDNIERDRAQADIIVDTSQEPTDVKRHKEDSTYIS